MQNNVCPSPGSNAVTHIATMSEHLFSFFVFLHPSLHLLCPCPFFLLYWQYQVPVSKHLSFTSIYITFVSLCSQKKPLPEASDSLFWHLKQSRLKLVLRKQGIQWLSLDKTITSTSYWWPFRPTYARVVHL